MRASTEDEMKGSNGKGSRSPAARTPTPGLKSPQHRPGGWLPPGGRNAVKIRTQRKPDPSQPLPAFPAKVRPIPCKALQEARDRARHRRQIPLDMSVTNYLWKGKGKQPSVAYQAPPHIGQTRLESIESGVKSPTDPCLLEEPEERGGDDEVNELRTQRTGPPEAVRRIGYVMKYRPRLQPRAWKSDGYIANVTRSDQIKCLLASSELEFKDEAPWVEVMQNRMLIQDDPPLSPTLSSLSLRESSNDYEWIRPELGSSKDKVRLREGIGRRGFTVEGILAGAIHGPIDLRRDGKMDYIGAIDDLGQRTRSAAFGVDRLVSSQLYIGSTFNSVNDMGLRMWAYENGFQLDSTDSNHDMLSTQNSQEWPVDEEGLPVPFWPPRKVPVFNRSERKDVQRAFSINPDLPVATSPAAIPFESPDEKAKDSPPRPGPHAKDEDTEFYTLRHVADHCPGPAPHAGANFRSQHQGCIIEETSKDLAMEGSDVLGDHQADEEDGIPVGNATDHEHFHPAKPLTFDVDPSRQQARAEAIDHIMVMVNWTEYFEDSDGEETGPILNRQNALKNLMLVDDEPQRRRARVCIHTETVLPSEDSAWMPEALTGRKRNRALSLVFVEDIEAMEEMLGLNRDRHAGHCGEGKMMVRHWGRMKRVFESVVISCPETMRVHMVRYNLQSNMQQYKLDGLVAALAQVEGGAETFFHTTLPHLIARACTIGDLLKHDHGTFPTMRKDESNTIEIPRVLVAAILCNMMLCALPNNDFSFSELLCSNQSFQVTKLCCFINYFRRLSLLTLDEPKGKIKFVRSSINGHFNWRKCEKPLTRLNVIMKGQAIDADPGGNLHVVPAYKNVGGGMVYRRCTPEEVHLCNRPELCVAMIVVPPLGHFEALHMTGAERYNETVDEGFHLSFVGNHQDTSARAEDGVSFVTTLVAMDAFKFEDYKDASIRQQIAREHMQRDLDKAHVSFRDTEDNRVAGLKCVACSSWGMGAPYRGEQEVKVLLLWMAASANQKSLEFYSHNVLDVIPARDLELIAQDALTNEYNVSELYMALAELSASQVERGQLLPLLREYLAKDFQHQDRGEEDDDDDDYMEDD